VTSGGDFAVTREPLAAGGAVVYVQGELDMATAPVLEEALVATGFSERVVIDLTGCTFLDSSAVRLLVASVRDSEAAGGTLELVAPEPGILKVLEISGVNTMLPVHATLDDAV
jgi:anti-anti-sigma factor